MLRAEDQSFKAMDKTSLEINTPGGRPETLENPPSMEAGPMDSGRGGQLLLENDPFKRSSKVLRSPGTSGSQRSSSERSSFNLEEENK